MRYAKEHREESRHRILEQAGKRFRKDGLAAAGIAGLMKDAGLTNGAFYNHFASKEVLVQEVLADVLDQRFDELQEMMSQEGGMEASIRTYLSALHRDNPEVGCPSASLAPEIARHPRETRALYTAKLSRLIELIGEHFPDGESNEREEKAAALFALLIGSLQLARAVSNKKLSTLILEGGTRAALQLVAQGQADATVAGKK